MKIITLTLNPAFDIHCYTEHFMPYHENLAQITDREAGGKGVNISRALTVCGVPNTALVVMGDENAAAFRSALNADGMNFIELTVPGRIRENITLHTENAAETRISFAGFTADDSLICRVRDTLAPLVDRETIVTFTGRIPDGVTLDAVKHLLRDLTQKGVRTVIDSRSFTRDDILECRPWLIKPNEEEIALYSSRPVTDLPSAALAAEEIHREGIENVMISLGSHGAVLACSEGTFTSPAPPITPLSTIGAGDSSIAGFLAAAHLPPAARLRHAISYGTAACLTSGTKPPRCSDVELFLKGKLVENG